MRLNIYLNEKNSKEKLIIDFLDSKLNKSAFIKELLYEKAHKIKDLNNLDNYKKVEHGKTETNVNNNEYEEILSLEDINF